MSCWSEQLVRFATVTTRFLPESFFVLSRVCVRPVSLSNTPSNNSMCKVSVTQREGKAKEGSGVKQTCRPTGLERRERDCTGSGVKQTCRPTGLERRERDCTGSGVKQTCRPTDMERREREGLHWEWCQTDLQTNRYGKKKNRERD